jgi:hypothetical protein
VDPQGNRKQKIYANYGRYAYVLPLDAAIRALSNEEDFQNSYWAPANAPCTVGGNSATCVTLNSLGSTDFSGDSGHLLNLANGGIPIASGALVTGGEPFAPGTRMEFTDEFLVGYDREFKGGVVASVRYIDRRLKRVIEDQGGISVEEFNALAGAGGGLNYSIGNPNAKQDVFVNPNEIVFAQGTTFVVPTDNAGVALPLTPANEQAYLNAGMPKGCFDSFGFGTPFVAYNQSNGFNAANGGAIAGSACFPAVNTNTWTDASGNLLSNAASASSAKYDPGKCTPLGAKSLQSGCVYFGGEFIPDGKADTYRDPKREYEAVEFEVRKAFTHNWALSVNYRVAQLRGNYEGAFRNDNGQADPGISSLFDLTEGALGLLQNQQSIGFLSTDRKHVLNGHSTYVVPNGKLKGFVVGGGVSVLSGNPLSTLVAQQAYVQPGEVPIFGRGDLGRSPVTGSVDAHLEYPFKLSERMQVKVAFDLFNIVDSTRNTTVQQFYDVNFGLKNLDFGKPVTNNGLAYPASFTNQGFVNPFNSRLSVLFTF